MKAFLPDIDQWFQSFSCVDIKFVNQAVTGNDLVQDIYVDTITKIRVLKKVPKHCVFPWRKVYRTK